MFFSPNYRNLLESDGGGAKRKPDTKRPTTCPQMFDFKMCLLDLIRVAPNQNHLKKSKSSKFGRYPPVDMLQKYHDINIIHFNENMSMMNRMDNIKFVPYSRHPFKSSPTMMSGTGGFATARKKNFREWGVETVSFDFSSDDRMTPTTSGESADERLDFSDSAIQTSSANDSFCTLCTSSFSFSNCNNCADACGSKCGNELLQVCERRRKRPDPIKIERWAKFFYFFFGQFLNAYLVDPCM